MKKIFLNICYIANIFYSRSKSEGVDIHTIDTIDAEHEIDTPKPVKKRGRRPKIKEETIDVPISSEDTLQDDIDKEMEKQQKCSSVDNLIEMLEDDCKDNNDSIGIEEECTQKLIQPADIKQEAQEALLADIDIDEDEDEDLDDSTILDDDDSDYEGNDDSKNDGAESSSPKKSKMTKSTLKKKTPEILIPQMVSYMCIYFYGNTLRLTLSNL